MAKLGGRHLSSQERFRIISSRGARGLNDLGRYVFGYALHARPLTDHSRETCDPDRLCTRIEQSRDARIAGRPARQNIVDQNDVPSLENSHPSSVNCDRALQCPFALGAPKPTETRRPLSPDQGIDQQGPLAALVEFTRQKGGLIEAALP